VLKVIPLALLANTAPPPLAGAQGFDFARLVVLREKCPRKWTTIKGMPSSPWIMLELRVSYTGYRMDNMYLRVMACEGGD